MSSAASEKEARLLKVISKLEAKVRSIWEDNNQLKQRVELAQLDKEIAEEQRRELDTELRTAKARIVELEELVALSDELEASYIAERESLEAQKVELEKQLTTSHWHTQELESLKLELGETSSLLEVAKLELSIIKNGAAASLGPIFGEESEEWLSLIDFLKVDFSEQMEEFKSGKCSKAKFARALRDLVDRVIDDPALYKHTGELPANRGQENSPLWKRVADNLSQKPVDSDKENSQRTHDANINGETQYDPAIQLRVSVLESKLSQAQEVADELDRYRERLRQSAQQQTALEDELSKYKELASKREKEMVLLHRRNLPNELSSAQNALYINSLQSCISFLSSARPNLVLDKLAIEEPPKISALAGNKKIRNMRQVAAAFSLAQTPEEARKLAIQQRAQLMLL